MEFQVAAELTPPRDAPELDALARAGVAALLAEQLDLVSEQQAELVEHAITVHPAGAEVALLFETDIPTDTTDTHAVELAGTELLAAALAQAEPLAGWTVATSQAAPSDDGDVPGEAEQDTDDDIDGLDGLADELAVAEAEMADAPETLREQLLAAAERLHAFGLDAFGYHADAEATPITEYQAQLVAGALVQGLEVLTDQCFDDVEALRQAHATAADCADLTVLDELPEQLASAYDPLFAQQFLVTTAILGHRLSQPDWTPPLCAAEALALHLVKGKAADQLGMAEADEELPLDVMFAVFDEYAFEDTLHEELFDAEEHDDPAEVVGWFLPYTHLTAALHPYLDPSEEPPE